jgi:hypothetical protein
MACNPEIVAESKSTLFELGAANISVSIVRNLLCISGNPMMMSIPGILCTTKGIFDSTISEY